MIDNFKPGLWFTISQALKFFVIIFCSLILVLTVILILGYTDLTNSFLSVPTAILINKIILTIGILAVVSIMCSWYLTNAAIKQKRQEIQPKILNKLLETISDFVILHSAEGIILLSNQAAYKTLGYSKEEFSKTNIYTNVDKDYVNYVTNRYL